MNLTHIFTLITLCILSGSVSAQLYLVQITESSYNRVRTLSSTGTEKVCPKDYEQWGFTVECVTNIGRSASIRVNRRWVRTEQREPFFVSGDAATFPRRWENYPSIAVIDCLPDARRTGALTTKIEFTCDDEDSSTTTPNASPSLSPSASPSQIVDEVPRHSPSITPSATSSHSQSVSPSDIVGEVPGYTQSITPSATPSHSQSVTPPEIADEVPGPAVQLPGPVDPPVPTTSCIKIDARADLLNKTLPEGWVVDNENEGLTFRKGDDSTSITPKRVAPLYYSVTANADKRFAIVVDMTTRGNADHNDIWVRFSEKIQATHSGDSVIREGWVKGYHNENGRATRTFTVDFTPHILSTGIVLQTGMAYKLGIGGRSSKVTVHKIYMFSCAENSCQRGDRWNEALERCMAWYRLPYYFMHVWKYRFIYSKHDILYLENIVSGCWNLNSSTLSMWFNKLLVSLSTIFSLKTYWNASK